MAWTVTPPTDVVSDLAAVMRATIPLLSSFFAAAACQSTAPHGPGPDVALQQLRAEMHSLVAVFATRQGAAEFVAPTAPDTIALEARLGALTERLDELIAHLPVLAGTRAVEATSRKRTDAEVASIQALREALAIVDRAQQVIVENLANVNTAGYKKRELRVTSECDERTGLLVPCTGRVTAVFTAGTLEITERSLDVAIDGEGFFAIVLPDGSTGYTRDGGFHLDADGKIVTGDGGVVLPEIALPSDTLEISIEPSGTVMGRTAGAPDSRTRFGQLELHRFLSPTNLQPVTANVLRPTEASGAPCTGRPGSNGLGVLKQGFVERSNVQLLGESVNLQVWRRQRAELRRALAAFGVFVP